MISRRAGAGQTIFDIFPGECPHMPFRNLAELHRRRAECLGPRTAVRFRRHGVYHDLSWERYRADALACAAALVAAGVRPGDRVALLAENRLEWLLADLGMLTAAAVTVPLHAPLTARQVQFQLADAGVCWAFVSTEAQLAKLEQVCGELPGLRGVVVLDRAVARGDVVTWPAFLQCGRRALPHVRAELARREAALGPDDVATIMYTSGTTGNPKGVMLTHGNLLSNTLAMLQAQPPSPGEVLLSWLPLSHIYARTVDHYQTLASGVPLCLAESAETVVRDLGEVRPTRLSAVPRFYEKVLTAVASDDAAETSRRLCAAFGPRIDWLNSGGAPLPPAIAEAYHRAGLLLLQGYGLTESSPVISFNRKDSFRLDTVGPPLPGVEVAIAPDGEVLTRGPHVMKGYWNNPAATTEALRDGWLYTGDLGALDADGHLRITGRKKELLVLSSGKKVVPPYLEGLLLADPCIDQAVVCGEGKSFLTALLVPHWDNLRRALRTEGAALDGQAPEALAEHAAVRAFLERRLTAALRDVSRCEQVRKFVVLPRPLTVAGDELTVSLKLRRQVIADKYAAQLEALYRES
jgi:long-chain acyl-CoA synthetase